MSISASDLSRARPYYTGVKCAKNYRDRASLRRIKLQTISKQQELWLGTDWPGYCNLENQLDNLHISLHKKLISELLMGSEWEWYQGPSNISMNDCHTRVLIKSGHKYIFPSEFNNCVQNKQKIHQFKISANSGCQNLNLICHLQTAQ